MSESPLPLPPTRPSPRPSRTRGSARPARSTTRTPGCATATIPTRSPTSRPRTPTRRVLRPARRPRRGRCSPRSSRASRRPTSRCPCSTGRGGTSPAPIEGESYPVFCRGRSIDDASRRHPRLQRRGRRSRLLRRPRRRPVAGPHAAGLVERRRRRRALHAAGARPRHRRRPRRRADRHVVVGRLAWSSDGAWLFYARPDEQMRPYQIWRHRLGTPVADDALVHRGARRALLPRRRLDPQRAVDRHHHGAAGRRTEVRVAPGRRPDRRAGARRGRGRARSSTRVDDWGDRFVILTNLDAPDFRVMTAPLDEPGEWTELVPHEPGRRFTSAEPFAGHLVLHEWSDAQPKVARAVPRRPPSTCSTSAPSPTTSSSAPTRSGTRRRCALSYQSLTTPLSVYDVDVVHGRARRCASRRRRRASTSTATCRRGRGRPRPTARRCPSTSSATSTPRSTARRPASIYGYGSYEASMPPWFSVARLSLLDRGVGVGARAPARRRRARSALVPRRQAAEQAQHVHRHDRRAPSTSSPSGWADAARVAVRGGSAGGLLVGACITMRPDLFASRRRRGAVRRRRHDDERRDAAADGQRVGGVGRPARRAVRQLHAALLARTTTPARPTYPALYVTAGLNDPRVSYHEPAKWVARLRAVGAGRDRLLCCAPRWAPATAAPAAATTPGATRPAPSPSCSPRSDPSASAVPRTRRHRTHDASGQAKQATTARTMKAALRSEVALAERAGRPRAEAGARRVAAVDELTGDHHAERHEQARWRRAPATGTAMPGDQHRAEHQLDARARTVATTWVAPIWRAWAIHVEPAASFAPAGHHEHRAEHDGWRCARPRPRRQLAPRSTTSPSRAANTSTPMSLPQPLAAAARRSSMSSSWLGSWWNSASRLAPHLAGQPHRVLDGAVAPVDFLANSAGVYWASWISRSTPWHRRHTPSAMRGAVDRLLVIADVGDARRAVGHPVAERLADVGHGARSRRRSRRCGTCAAGSRTSTWPGKPSRPIGNSGGQIVADSTSAAVRPSSLGRAVHDEPAVLVEQRTEERQALDVVPVQVAEQARAPERHVGRAAQPEVAQPGAEVEQQRVLAGDVDGHARRVAAVAADVIAMARGRAPDAMKP